MGGVYPASEWIHREAFSMTATDTRFPEKDTEMVQKHLKGGSTSPARQRNANENDAGIPITLAKILTLADTALGGAWALPPLSKP